MAQHIGLCGRFPWNEKKRIPKFFPYKDTLLWILYDLPPPLQPTRRILILKGRMRLVRWASLSLANYTTQKKATGGQSA